MKIRLQDQVEIDAPEGETLLASLGRAGIPVSAPCGGKHRCKKCKVILLRGQIRDTVSGNLVEGNPDSPPEVLACSSIPQTDLTIALISANAYEGGAYEALLTPYSPFPTPHSPKKAGVALDIGTTTVSARLVDLDTGRELDTYSALNRQRVYGADVMSRIGAAREGKTAELFNIINRQTEEILSSFIQKFNLHSIETLTVAANTTMLHFFANENPSAMGEMPFTPKFLEDREYSGSDFSLPVDRILLFPSVSAFIGGDIVSGLAEINVLDAGEIVFFIDIGTNGEMALFHKGKLVCTSAAAGPALEGAEISCGLGSVSGAINKVQYIEGKIHYETIGNEAPAGICGCGLIDAMAVMLDQGVIDETGAFQDDDCRDFVIAPKISLTNRDVRQYQLAKSAILSAISILCKNNGVALADIAKVYVAGGLGFYIDEKSAIRTGLLPEEFSGRITVSGNTSLKGAIKALADPEFIQLCKEIKNRSVVMNLASDPEFMNAFAGNMIFP